MVARTLVIAVLFSLCALQGTMGTNAGTDVKPVPVPGPEGGLDKKITPKEDVGDLTGFYLCKGKEANGKSYSGLCSLTKKNDVYLVSWMVGGGSSFSGIGIRQGGSLAVSWNLPTEKGVVRGVNLYRIDAGPKLHGKWATLPGSGTLQTETLTFLRKMVEDVDE